MTDTDWLDDNAATYVTGNIAAEIDYKRYAQDYSEHVSRWRPITETPEVGQNVVVKSKGGMLFTFTWANEDVFMSSHDKWFLLPEIT